MGISASAVGEFLRRAIVRLKKATMSSPLRHPEAEQLLRYADGELPSRQAGRSGRICNPAGNAAPNWKKCRRWWASACAIARTCCEPHLPPPPPPGATCYEFDEIDASLGRRPWLGRLRPAMRWVPVAAALAVAGLPTTSCAIRPR